MERERKIALEHGIVIRVFLDRGKSIDESADTQSDHDDTQGQL